MNRPPRHGRPKPDGETRTRGWFHTIGEVRNSLLVAVSLVYLLGYAVWSSHAWDKNLGVLPLLDSQYFIAGIVPAATLLLAIYAFRGGRRLIGILERQFDSRKKGWRLRLSRVLIGLLLFSTAVFLLSSSDWFEKTYPYIAERAAPMSALALIATAFFAPWAGGAFQKYFRMAMLGYLVIVLCVIGALSSFWIVGWLPQELGGLRARCASISVPRTAVSNEIREQVFTSGTGGEEIVQSDMVAVFYSGSYLLFTSLDPGTGDKESGSIVFELPRNIVKGITWYPKCP